MSHRLIKRQSFRRTPGSKAMVVTHGLPVCCAGFVITFKASGIYHEAIDVTSSKQFHRQRRC